MVESDVSASELADRARRREAIGLSPQRPTAKTVVHSPPEARRSVPLVLVILVVFAAIAAATVLLRPSLLGLGLPGERAGSDMEVGRLIERDDFAEPQFALQVGGSDSWDKGYVGDLYRIRITRPGGRVWSTLGQPDLGAYRVETDLRLASQEAFSWGYGGLIVRYQNDENFYLFAIDNRGQYQIELAEVGAWRTVRPWTESDALSNGRRNLLSVADDGSELRFYINGVQVDAVPDPRLPAGDIGLVVGARSRGQAQGLFDWVALYEIEVAE